MKWQVEELRQDYIDRLKEQLRQCFSADLHAFLFHKDFKKQAEGAQHLISLMNNNLTE